MERTDYKVLLMLFIPGIALLLTLHWQFEKDNTIMLNYYFRLCLGITCIISSLFSIYKLYKTRKQKETREQATLRRAKAMCPYTDNRKDIYIEGFIDGSNF